MSFTITKETYPQIWTDLMAYMSMLAVIRAANDLALVPQNQGAFDAVMFLETVRKDILHDQLWGEIHKVFKIDPNVAYECHATPDFKIFTLDLATAPDGTPMH